MRFENHFQIKNQQWIWNVFKNSKIYFEIQNTLRNSKPILNLKCLSNEKFYKNSCLEFRKEFYNENGKNKVKFQNWN